MFNLLITARSFGYESQRALNILKSFPNIRVDRPDHTASFYEDIMCELIQGRDAVIVGTDRVTAKVISRADKLKVISKNGVGVDNKIYQQLQRPVSS